MTLMVRQLFMSFITGAWHPNPQHSLAGEAAPGEASGQLAVEGHGVIHSTSHIGQAVSGSQST